MIAPLGDSGGPQVSKIAEKLRGCGDGGACSSGANIQRKVHKFSLLYTSLIAIWSIV